MNEYGYKFAYLMIVESFISVFRPVLPSQESRQGLAYDRCGHGRSALDFSGGRLDVKNFVLLVLV